MISTALLSLVILRQQGGNTPVATFTMAGKQVAVTLPTESESQVDSTLFPVVSGGFTYQFDGSDNLVARFQSEDVWSDIRRGYETASKTWTKDTPVWHVKAFVVPWTDILDHGRDGFLRQRRVLLTDDQIDRILQGLGRFAVAADAAGEGTVRVQLNVEIDRDTWLTDAFAGRGVFNEIEGYVKPRINGAGFQDDDHVYRGPFDSVYVLHSGLSSFRTPVQTVSGQRVTTMSVVPSVSVEARDHFESQMLQAWGEDLAAGARGHGLAVGSPSRQGKLLDAYTSCWGLLKALDGPMLPRAVPTVEELRKNMTAARAPQSLTLPVPMLPGLPIIDRDKFLAKLVGGGEGLERARSGHVAFTVQGLSGEFVFAELPYADYVVKNLKPASNPRVLGILPSSGDGESAYLVVSVEGNESLLSLLGAGPNVVTGTTTASPSGAFSSNIKLEVGTDPTHGPTLIYTETGSYRWGSSVRKPENSIGEGKVLSFWVKTQSHEPVALSVARGSGVVLGRRDEAPAEGSDPSSPLSSFAIVPDGTWQHVEVELDRAVKNPSVMIGPPLYSQSYERRSGEAIRYEFADLQLHASLDGASKPDAPAVGADSPDEYVRARYALKATSEALVPLLKDSSDLVRLNAAARFSAIQNVAAEPMLGTLAQARNPRVVKAAIDALVFQQTPTAKAAIRKALDDGPFDWNRALAARALAVEKSPELAGSFSTLFAAKGWRERVEGAKALSSLKGEQSMAILMSFLLNADPAVRIAATESADISTEIVQRRVQYSAVNDPADAVRAASYILLLSAPTPALQDEGRKGTKDDGVQVRIAVLTAIGGLARAEDRAVVLQGLLDKDASVRASAISALGKLPGSVTLEELSSVLREEYPEPQAELIRLAQAKMLTLPASTIDLLKKSVSAQVRDMARSLGE